MARHYQNYSEIYLQVYCTLLAKSEASGFAQSIPSTQDKDRADAIAKLAGVHTDTIIKHLMTNFAQETQSIES